MIHLSLKDTTIKAYKYLLIEYQKVNKMSFDKLRYKYTYQSFLMITFQFLSVGVCMIIGLKKMIMDVFNLDDWFIHTMNFGHQKRINLC